MPIEIKELHIRVTVNTPTSAQPPDGEKTSGAKGGPAEAEARDAIVAECVEQVLHILQNRKER